MSHRPHLQTWFNEVAGDAVTLIEPAVAEEVEDRTGRYPPEFAKETRAAGLRYREWDWRSPIVCFEYNDRLGTSILG